MGTPSRQLLWWEHQLAVEGLSDEAFSLSQGEEGLEGFKDFESAAGTADDLERLGFQVNRR